MDEFFQEWSLHHSYRQWIAVGLRGSPARPGFSVQPRCGESLRPHVQGLHTVMAKRMLRVLLSNLKVQHLNLWIPLEKWKQRWGVCVPHRAAELLGLRSCWNMERTKVAQATNTIHPKFESTTVMPEFWMKKMCLTSYVITNYVPAPWKTNTFISDQTQLPSKMLNLPPLRWRW